MASSSCSSTWLLRCCPHAAASSSSSLHNAPQFWYALSSSRASSAARFRQRLLACSAGPVCRTGRGVELGVGCLSQGFSLVRTSGLSLVRASVTPEVETDEIDKDVERQGKVDLEKDISKAVRKTAATFAPRASSSRNKNPAQPGTTLYSIFEIQAYVSMLVGGVLSFNLLFPSDHPDIWRLMGMWSVWMFTIPSLRARDCSSKEKEALNYLFLAVPLINVTLPLVWKSFAAVWSADVIAFLAMYAWKLEWIGGNDKTDSSSS